MAPLLVDILLISTPIIIHYLFVSIIIKEFLSVAEFYLLIFDIMAVKVFTVIISLFEIGSVVKLLFDFAVFIGGVRRFYFKKKFYEECLELVFFFFFFVICFVGTSLRFGI
jgi:hypothetical protein